MKQCAKCHEILPLDQFHKRTGSRAQSYCKVCQIATVQANYAALAPEEKQRRLDRHKAWAMDNPEIVAAAHHQSYQKHRAQRLASQKQYRERQPEEVKQHIRDVRNAHYRKNAVRIRAQRRAWYFKHHERFLLKQRERYRLLHDPATMTPEKQAKIDRHKRQMREWQPKQPAPECGENPPKRAKTR